MTAFEGRAILVTGAGTGIGAACAQLLAEQGASVAVVGLKSDPLDEVVDGIQSAGGKAIAVPADVTSSDDMQAAVDRTVAEFGALHHGVNCAGISGVSAVLHEEPVDDWNQVIAVNLSGVFYAMRAEVGAMMSAGYRGSIVNIASVQASHPLSHRTAYTASKFGVVGLTKVAARDYAEHGIRINAVSPGITDTPMMRSGGAQSDEIAQFVPLQRVAEPVEMARAVAFLLAEETGGYITGIEILVDGGQLLRPI